MSVDGWDVKLEVPAICKVLVDPSPCNSYKGNLCISLVLAIWSSPYNVCIICMYAQYLYTKLCTQSIMTCK